MCSIVVIGDPSHRRLAVNYDYNVGHGLVATNVRGTQKENVGRGSSAAPFRWVAEHGSVSFNSLSLELPTAGMNERGLCGAMASHETGNFGRDGSAARLDPLHWLQNQLDVHSDVDAVIAALNRALPWSRGVALHYMFLDAAGQSVIIEAVDAELRVVRNPPIPVLTNTTYEECISSNGHAPAGSSLGRFETLKRLFSTADPSHPFRVLEAVRQSPLDTRWKEGTRPTTTVWSLVFDPVDRRVSFRTHANPDTRWISLRDVELDRSVDYLCMDVHDGFEGDVSPLLQSYRREDNQRIVSASSQLLGLTTEKQDTLVAYVDDLYSTRGA